MIPHPESHVLNTLEAKVLERELRERAEWRAANEGPFTKENLIEWRAAEFISALSTRQEAAAQSEEPVAWRCKDYSDSWIIYQDFEWAQECQREMGCLMQPLYVASPAVAPVAVSVGEQK